MSACALTTISDDEPAGSERGGSDHDSNDVTAETAAINVDKELLIVDPSVINDSRAQNATVDAPWSFRSQLEWMASSSEHAPALVEHWLESWAEIEAVGPKLAPVAPRPKLRELLLEPWRELSVAADSEASAVSLSLALAPFRLIAIVNRVDLSAEGCSTDNGDVRFVYTALSPLTERPLDATLIIELPLPATRTASEWARAFHALGTLPFGPLYDENLATLTHDVQKHAARSSLRLRTNESAFAPSGAGWQMRDFRIQDSSSGPELVQVPLERTPRSDVKVELRELIENQREAVLAGSFELPVALRAGAAELPRADFRWESLDELGRRAQRMSALLNANCSASSYAP